MSGRAERPVKRLRRLSTDYDDSDAGDDWTQQQSKGVRYVFRKAQDGHAARNVNAAVAPNGTRLAQRGDRYATGKL